MKKRENFLLLLGAGKIEMDKNVLASDVSSWTGGTQPISADSLYGAAQGRHVMNVRVISGSNRTSGVGSAYLNKDGAISKGQHVDLAASGYTVSGSAGAEKVNVKKITGTGSSAANGYTLAEDDRVEIYKGFQSDDGLAIRPSDMFAGTNYDHARGEYFITFYSILGEQAVDTFRINGIDTMEKARLMDDVVAMAVEAKPHTRGMITTIVDLHKSEIFRNPYLADGTSLLSHIDDVTPALA